jgi:phage terminase large subunit-like protein
MRRTKSQSQRDDSSPTAPLLKLSEIIRLLPGYDPYDQAGSCWFDEQAAQNAIDFIQECVKLAKGTKDRPAGQPFILELWQRAIVANLFGWKRPDGTRRYRECFIYVAKKNGKTALVAAILLLVLATDDEYGAELYSAAASRDQAALLFQHASGMVKLEEELSSRLTVYGAKGGSQQRAIVNESMMSSYKCLSADADTADGANPHFVAADEIHRHRNAELIDVLQKSTATRAQPIVMYTSTADYNRPSPCNELLKRAKRVRDNKGDPKKVGFDPEFLPVLYEVRKEDNWRDPKVWRQANPNIGVTLTEDFLARECRKADETPSELNNFLRLHLNIVTDADEAWISLDKWDACSGLLKDETPKAWRARVLEESKGCSCFVGMDLSAKIDLTAIVLIFKPDDPRGTWRIVPFFWVPAETAEDKEKKDRVPYAAWQRDGFVSLTDGNEVDSQALRRFLNQSESEYPISELGYDEWNATELARQLREEDGFGDRMVIVRQGSKSLSDPMKEFEAMVMSGRVEHGGNPVMHWMIGNLCVKRDENDNIQPNKRKSTGRIDGPVATFTGMARALAADVGAGQWDGKVLVF